MFAAALLTGVSATAVEPEPSVPEVIVSADPLPEIGAQSEVALGDRPTGSTATVSAFAPNAYANEAGANSFEDVYSVRGRSFRSAR